MRSWLLGLVVGIGLASAPLFADEPSLTGVWNGSFTYDKDAQPGPVKFDMILIQTGDDVGGYIRETRTFGEGNDPWLFAAIAGSIENGELAFKKTYDGTGQVDHDVSYRGKLSADRTAVDGGVWQIDADNRGAFELTKDPKTGTGPVAGMWEGTYSYGAGAGQAPVSFALAMVYRGSDLTGFVTEPNSFAQGNAPKLHATLSGRFSKDNRVLTFKKTYDGTANASHDVDYRGTLGADDVFEGTWKIGADATGSFLLNRAPAAP